MRRTLSGVLLLGVMVLVTGVARADRFQTFTGSTVGASTFNRPTEGGASSGVITRFRSQRFELTSDTECTIYSSQDYDGFLHLYRAPFNPASPLTNLVQSDDDAELGVGTSRIPRDLSDDGISLMPGVYTLVNSGFGTTDQGAFENFIQCDGSAQPVSPCFFSGYPREKQVCLQERFAVKIDQISNHATDGRGTPVRFASSDSSFFWFYNDKNFEVMIKVINGCALTNHWWVFFAGTTNQAYRIQVGDAATQAIKTYTRNLGPPSPAETDTAAFNCP